MESEAAVASLLKRLDEEEAVVRGELDVLREKIAEAQDRLDRLDVTREVLRSLAGIGSGRQESSDPDGPGRNSSGSAAGHGSGGRDDPDWPLGVVEWEEGRERMLVLLAGAGRAMKVRDIAAAIGEDVSLVKRVETTRSRLKRLLKEKRVVEGPVGWFAIAPASDARAEGDARVR
ncbi:hypothetical protein [Streptomyces radicis]|uniref:Uncharacterized protein n=1 Tax=Streptomyces radicis TaxID=1750517 RepID=A0A3A9VPU2_9ACTN|nr:hypothetical protein [Streptomyces radicis]RKN03111.1 hypothetical protein D7319_32180 [Streptomyces radicis]RKN13045.1 hypothetical protein D7318_32095 [Streptomyces radicis]